MVVELVLSALESGIAGYQGRVLGAALAVIAAGSLLTAARRLAEIRKGLVER